ncbi:MAG TPA: PRC-barrel domain-containing protein [Solirubrobacteraceae bacterium]|nr:PRC-barrel domain-containing protein [Solirubrobacteraceae bacterium]
MTDSGAPMSYLTLERGTPVRASDGTELGTVAHVLADPDADIFDGIVLDARGGGYRFVDAPQVAEIAEGAVTLALDGAAAERLPEPTESPAEMRAEPDDTAEGELTRKLRRAWELISGRY